MSLNRWKFRDRQIEVDGWFPFAGRSNVAADRGLVWLRIEGIPLHLRSSSLFSQLGRCCGNFMDFFGERMFMELH
ncbi:hypothetical protein LINGRAHAP2_LOCUS10525 [Linum grandiflorum]